MSNHDIQYRIATLDDAERIQQMVVAAFRAEDSRPNWTAGTELARGFHIGVDEVVPHITDPESVILMAVDKDDVLLASVEVKKKSSDLVRFSMLAVDQNRQRGGLGRQFLAYAEDYAQRTWGVRKFGLNALSTREKLISWYKRCGYKETGELRPFDVQIEGVDLPKDMFFVEMEKTLG